MKKQNMKYRVVDSRDPRTGKTLSRPLITYRETYYTDQLIRYALNAGYVRGQFQDVKGTLYGIFEAIRALLGTGKAVNIDNFIRLCADLTGTLSDDHQLSASNKLRVIATAQKGLQLDINDYSWSVLKDFSAFVKAGPLKG